MSIKKSWTPLVLTVLGLGVLGSLAVYRVLNTSPLSMQLATAAAVAIYLAWMLWESRVSVDEISKPEDDHDRGTMEICAVVKILLLLSAIVFGGGALPVAIVGIALIVAGIKLRTSAIRALGTSYSHRIRTPQLPLVSTGPYSVMRHPAYAGTLLIHAGVVCVGLNWFSIAALALWFAAVWYRTRVEEAWLNRTPEYSQYRSAVPGAWLPSAGWVQSRLPIIFSASFVTLICWLSALKLAALPVGLAVALGAVVLFYLAWLAMESRLAVGELSKDRTRVDRGTCELYAFGRAATVLSALALPGEWTGLGLWYPIGFGIFVAGVLLRLSAIRSLGRYYSHRVRVTGSQKIVTHGPYRTLRHPAYSGMILAHCGFVLCFFNVTSAAILLMILAPAVILRIRVEERVLFEIDGYREYAQRRARLIPLVW